MKRIVCMPVATLLVVLAMCSVSLAAPRNDNDNDQEKNRDDRGTATRNSSDSGESHAFLGVAVAPLDDSLRSHLQRQIPDGSGIVVEEVADDSPAQKAGLRQHDILISFDDQRLYSPEQLVRLVDNDKPGREAKLHIIRNGKSQDIEATLGSQQAESGTRSRRAYSWPTVGQQGNSRGQWQNQQGRDNQREDQSGQRNNHSAQGDNQWKTFDAMALSRVDKNHFKAEIRYRDDRGNVESRHFEGTPDQIRQHLEDQKDLPRAERDRLLRALDVANTPGDVEFEEFHFSNQRS